jgi:hypothetical protein
MSCWRVREWREGWRFFFLVQELDFSCSVCWHDGLKARAWSLLPLHGHGVWSFEGITSIICMVRSSVGDFMTISFIGICDEAQDPWQEAV